MAGAGPPTDGRVACHPPAWAEWCSLLQVPKLARGVNRLAEPLFRVCAWRVSPCMDGARAAEGARNRVWTQLALIEIQPAPAQIGPSRPSAEQALSLGAIGSVSAGSGPFAGRWQAGTWAWELPGSSQRAFAVWLGGRSSVPGLGCGVGLRA